MERLGGINKAMILLLYCVFKWMENKQDNSNENLIYWEFINTYLLQAKLLHDDRVCSMLMNHSVLLQHIEQNVNKPGKVQHVFMYTLSMVLDQIHTFDIKIDSFSLCLPIEKFTSPILMADDHLTTCCSLIFWISNLTVSAKASQKSTCNESDQQYSKTDIQLVEKEQKEVLNGMLSEDENSFHYVIKWKRSNENLQTEPFVEVVGHLSDVDIRMLYIYLQQCIIKEQPLTTDLSILCLDKLLKFSERNHPLYEHLQHQRWMNIVVSTTFSMCSLQDMSPSTVTLLVFSAVLLKHRIKYIQPFMKILIQLLSNTPTVSSDAEQLAKIFCLEQVIQNTISPVDPEQKVNLEEKLQTLISMKNTRNNSIEDLIYVEFLKLYPEVSML